MVRLNLSLDDARNCRETTTFVKNAKNVLNVRRKESSIWRINKEFYLKNPNNLTSLKKFI